MWVVLLASRGEFEGVRESLERESAERYTRTSTSTSVELLLAPETTSWPHLALLGEDVSRLKHLAQWVHRNLPVTGLVSSGLVPAFTPDTPQSTGPYFLPSLCLRSAGRIDIGGTSPVLYEEIPFDADIQRSLTQSVLHRPLEQPGRLFGADRKITDPEERKWLFHNLGVAAGDDFTAELLLLGKRFGTRVGCFKVLETAKDAIHLLQQAWTEIAKV